MESKSRATMAGAFVVVMVLMLIGTSLWFSQDRTVRVRYDIVTDRSVDGIMPQSNVELYGLNVGKVESVSFIGGASGQVKISMLLNKEAPINQATYATVSSRGVTGAVFVSLADDVKVPPENRKLLTDIAPEGERRIPLHVGTLDTLTEGATVVFTQIEELLSSVNALLTEENRAMLLETVKSFGDTAKQINTLGSTLDANVGKMASGVDTTVRQANETLKSLASLTQSAQVAVENLSKPDGAIQSITAGTQELAHAAGHLRYVTLPQVDRAAQHVTATLRAAKRLIEEIEDQPQMLVLGAGKAEPGPGEAGYQSPYK